MLTSKIAKTSIGALAAFGLGLLSQSAAAAMDEIVVYGTYETALAHSRASDFQLEIDSYMRDVNARLRSNFDQEFERPEMPKLQMAAEKLPSRG